MAGNARLSSATTQLAPIWLKSESVCRLMGDRIAWTFLRVAALSRRRFDQAAAKSSRGWVGRNRSNSGKSRHQRPHFAAEGVNTCARLSRLDVGR